MAAQAGQNRYLTNLDCLWHDLVVDITNDPDPATDWLINGPTVKLLLERNRDAGIAPGTAVELADMLGVSESYISHVLAGRKPGRTYLMDIAALLRVRDFRAICYPRRELVA